MKNVLIITVLLGSLTSFSQTLSLDTGETYAVVVGISDYQDPQIPDLRFADKDALAFAGFLQSPAGGELDKDHLKVLINEEATGAQIAIKLDWLWEVVKENDRVIIYFSGHGDVEKKSITQPGYLLGWDAPSRVYMAGGALNVRDLNDVVSTLSIQNKAKVVLITDACRAGKLSGSGIGGSQATAANLAKQYANEIKILSCQPDEYSIEGEQWGGGRGAFSYHLLDGLYGMADGNADLNVSLKEIGRYLEDNVTEQVAPEKQNPMILGDKAEKLTDVFPEIVNQLKEGRRGQMQLFNPTETRGIEADVLASVDSITQKIYAAFKRTLKEKQFLEPVDACADAYYEVLIKEPSMERLHSSMRRNYAAALQDDAQQVLNTMLKSGLTEQVLKSAKASEIYKHYPAYLNRAAELLGKRHYMYNILQARKYFFAGQMEGRRVDRRRFFKKALAFQPNMSHAYSNLILNCGVNQLDSAEYYFQKATDLVPSWVEPYLQMSFFYEFTLNQPDKAEDMLQLAGEIDSTSILIWYNKARFYQRVKKYELAEKWFLKVIESSGKDICFPCAHQDFGIFYERTRRYAEAGKQFKKANELDSTFINAYIGLGSFYTNTSRFADAEKQYQKAIQIDSTFAGSYASLGMMYYKIRHYAAAEKQLKKSIQLDSTNASAWVNLGNVYKDLKKTKEAETAYKNALNLNDPFTYPYAHSGLGELYKNQGMYSEAAIRFKKVIELDSNYIGVYNNMGLVMLSLSRFVEAEKYFKKSIQLDSTNWIAYSNLGLSYHILQRWQEAADMTQKALGFMPNDGGLLAELAFAYSYLPSKKEVVDSIFQKSITLDANWPDSYIYLAQYTLRKASPISPIEEKVVNQYMEQAFARGVGKNGALSLKDLQTRKDFKILRNTDKWNELMQKYFPDQHKK